MILVAFAEGLLRAYINIRLFMAVAFVLGGMSGASQAALVISGAPTNNVTCVGGVCTSTAKKAVLNAGDLISMLSAGDVTVKSDKDSKDIDVRAAFGWATASRLTLASSRGITIAKVVSVTGTGAVTLTTHNRRLQGGLSFVNSGRLTFWDTSSSLIINGNVYTLVASLPALIDAVNANPSGSYALVKNDKARKKAFRESPMDVVLTGHLEGLGNTISGLLLKPNTGVAGLITQIGLNGSVQNLSLTGLTIQTDARHDHDVQSVGGLAGISIGQIRNVHVSGTLQASNTFGASFGLLAGEYGGTIQNASAAGTISIGGTDNLAGGLVGAVTLGGDVVIHSSHASVDVMNAGVTGGLVGEASSIYASSATGNVSGNVTGGLVGMAINGIIVTSFATGNVTSSGDAGGLVGTSSGPPAIAYCYATGAVTGQEFVGGLIGAQTSGSFFQLYSTGAVTATGEDIPGGLIGDLNNGATSVSVWDMDTSGIDNTAQGVGNVPNYPGVTGLTDAQLKSGLPTGFDPDTWGQSVSINNGYPYLISNPPPH